MPDGFQKFVPALRRWLTRRVRSEVDVDDALQDIWLRSHRLLAEGEVVNSEAYLFRTASSVLTDRARRSRVRNESQHRPLENIDHPVDEITPDRVLLGKEALAAALEKLQRLPERTRDVFVLSRFEGLSYREIANGMGISVSAVEKHMIKALRHLMDTGA